MTALIALLLTFCFTVLPQTKPEPLDGVNRPFHDQLLDSLAGRWRITGTIVGQPREMNLTADWVLNHQFLFLDEKDANAASGKPGYEAHIYIGYDNASERYVIHWIDIFGGRFSETLGYGTRNGNSIRFNFEYPDGPFHNTFTWNAQEKSWHFFLEQKDAQGMWKTFAGQTATRVKSRI